MSVSIREYYNKKLKKKTYGYEVEILDNKGNRIRAAKRGFMKKSEAKDEGRLKELELKKLSNEEDNLKELLDKDKSKITVRELLTLWRTSKQSTISPKTLEFYENYSNMINKIIGDKKIKSLRPEHIEIMINDLLDSGISSTTARHYYNILNLCFNWAISRGYLNKNICSLVEKPKKIKKEMLVYNEIQLSKLLNRIKDMTCYTPVMLAATTGMRLGEICGLTWDCIDLENGFIEVKKQLQYVKKKLSFSEVKNNGSNRKIVLLPYTIKTLIGIKSKQDKLKDYFKDNYYKDKDYVVCQNDGTPYNPNYVGRNYARLLTGYKRIYKDKNGVITKTTRTRSLCDELNIPRIRFHDLRHTHASLMLKANIHPKIVSERLGHSTTKMTLDTYSHILPDMQREAINNWDINLE